MFFVLKKQQQNVPTWGEKTKKQSHPDHNFLTYTQTKTKKETPHEEDATKIKISSPKNREWARKNKTKQYPKHDQQYSLFSAEKTINNQSKYIL